MLADIDDPPKSRLPGLLIGTLIATPIVLAFALWVVPSFVGAILGGARDLDARLRVTDEYMQDLCSGRFNEDRDGLLCGCTLGVEFPSLDCRPHFNKWAVELQGARCEDEATYEEATSYCVCVETIAGKVAAAGDEVENQRAAANAYENCEALPDAIALPPASELAPPFE